MKGRTLRSLCLTCRKRGGALPAGMGGAGRARGPQGMGSGRQTPPSCRKSATFCPPPNPAPPRAAPSVASLAPQCSHLLAGSSLPSSAGPLGNPGPSDPTWYAPDSEQPSHPGPGSLLPAQPTCWKRLLPSPCLWAVLGLAWGPALPMATVTQPLSPPGPAEHTSALGRRRHSP